MNRYLGSFTDDALAAWFKGDPICPIPIDGRFIKIKSEGPTDYHPIGAMGTVKGSMFIENQAVYLVVFDNMRVFIVGPEPTEPLIVIMGWKIQQL